MTEQNTADSEAGEFRELTIGIDGFSDDERKRIGGICRLSVARAEGGCYRHGFRLCQLHPPEPSAAGGDAAASDAAPVPPAGADLYLLDADHPNEAYRRWLQQARASRTPVILVSHNPLADLGTNVHALSRTRLGGLLLRKLDQLVGRAGGRPTPQHGDKRCLVLADSHMIRAQLRLLLGESGIATVFAESADAALRKLMASRYHLIVIDADHPQADGYRLCRQIKTSERLTGLPLLLLCSPRTAMARVQAAMSGADKRLGKPVDHDELYQFLQQYQLHRPPPLEPERSGPGEAGAPEPVVATSR